MKEIKATRRQLRLALEEVLDEKGVTDRATRTSLIACFEQYCKFDWNAASCAFARGIEAALASDSSDEASYISRSGKIAVVATDQFVHLAAGGGKAEPEPPAFDAAFAINEGSAAVDFAVRGLRSYAAASGIVLTYAEALGLVEKGPANGIPLTQSQAADVLVKQRAQSAAGSIPK